MNIDRLIVLGGCHVNGFPVGDQKSFVSLLVSQLGVSNKKCVVTPQVVAKRLGLALHQVGKLSDEDLVILQLGSFETLAPLVFRRVHNAASVSQSTGISALESQAGWFLRWLIPLVRLAGNFLLFIFRELINEPAFSTQEFARQLSDPSISRALSQAGVVVVIGALPTRVLVRNIYRRRANSVLSQFARQRRYIFLDYFQAIEDAPISSVTIDPIHLNEKGHNILGKKIFSLLFENSMEKNVQHVF